MKQVKIDIQNSGNILQPFSGVEDINIKEIESQFDVKIFYDATSIFIDGEEVKVEQAKRAIKTLISLIKKYNHIDIYDVQKVADAVVKNKEEQLLNAMDSILTRTFTGKPIRPKTLGQSYFIDTFKKKDLTFAIGPAGTGKTFLAVAYAVELLKKGDVKRIILTRPAVEAGENLGFLPGDLKEKVDPYLRPLYDALDDLLSSEKTERYIEKNIIEIAPLAYMRGRTLDDAIVILDEAQNTTKAQMVMFLSRLGKDSKMIVTGDLTQIDLPKHQKSGLLIAQNRLHNIFEIGFVNLTQADIVRHPLVIKILDAFFNPLSE